MFILTIFRDPFDTMRFFFTSFSMPIWHLAHCFNIRSIVHYNRSNGSVVVDALFSMRYSWLVCPVCIVRSHAHAERESRIEMENLEKKTLQQIRWNDAKMCFVCVCARSMASAEKKNPHQSKYLSLTPSNRIAGFPGNSNEERPFAFDEL